jgi:xanthine/uracil/vitamin C permease (AzgA family)
LTIVPAFAYGPALVVVGILMIGAVKKMDFATSPSCSGLYDDRLMIITYNLGIGITAGFVSTRLPRRAPEKSTKSTPAPGAFGISAVFI